MPSVPDVSVRIVNNVLISLEGKSPIVSANAGEVVSGVKPDGSTGDVFKFTEPGSISMAWQPRTQTVGGHFSPGKQAKYNVLLGVGNKGSDDIALEMNADGTASLRTNVYGSSPTTIATSSSAVFIAGEWHHIVLTVDGSGNAIGYVDGVSIVQGVHSTVPGVGERNKNVLFGCGGGGQKFESFSVYEVNSYDSVLTPTQISTLADGTIYSHSQASTTLLHLSQTFTYSFPYSHTYCVYIAQTYPSIPHPLHTNEHTRTTRTRI